MASARCTRTLSRVSGHCSAPGYVRIAASRRRSCRSISVSLSSCITRAGAEKPCSAPLSLPWSGDCSITPEADKSLLENLPRLTRRVALADELAVGVDADQPGNEQQIAEANSVAVMADRRRETGDGEFLALRHAYSLRNPSSARQASRVLPGPKGLPWADRTAP